jgi:hypothetical protein
MSLWIVAKYGPLQKLELSLGFAIGESIKVAPMHPKLLIFMKN